MKGKKTCQTFYIKTANLLGKTGNITTGRKGKGKEGKKNRRKNSHIPGFKLLIVKGMPKKKKKTQTMQSARIRFLIIDNIYVAIMVYGES